jgi:hypothetical protein
MGHQIYCGLIHTLSQGGWKGTERYPATTQSLSSSPDALSSPSLAALSSEPLKRLTDKQPEEIDCHLGHAHTLMRSLSISIMNSHKDKVNAHAGQVARLVQQEDKSWLLDDLGTARRVFLCTGSQPIPSLPKSVVPGPRIIPLDAILAKEPSLITPEDTVTVVGGGHSAILALCNLLTSDTPPKKVSS